MQVIIPTEKVPKPGGLSRSPTQAIVKHEDEWHGVAILYARRVGDAVELRLFYEGHISERAKEEIGHRFGVGAIEWEL